MILARATWNLPVGAEAREAHVRYIAEHLPTVRSLPGIRCHALLRFVSRAGGAAPWWWRGEELTFDSRDMWTQAAPAWVGSWAELKAVISGPRIDVFELEDEFSSDAPAPGPDAGPAAALSGIWQVPANRTPSEVDPVYLDVHVPNVRRLPGLRRHRALKAIEWPPGEHPRAWRAAEIRFDSLSEFQAVYDTPEYDAIRKDGFNASVAGPDVDIYLIEEEWRPSPQAGANGPTRTAT